MNPDTRAVAVFETERGAVKAGFTVKLTKEQFKDVQGLNRKQRRAWLAQNRNKK